VSIAIGAAILIPSLVLLFGLVLGGRFDERPEQPGSLERAGGAQRTSGARGAEPGRPVGVAAAVCAAVGVPLTFFSDRGVGLAIGVILLLAALAAAASFIVPQVAVGGDADGR
jgi:hypothetical protein